MSVHNKQRRKKVEADLQQTIRRLVTKGASLQEIVIATNASVTKIIDILHHGRKLR